MNKPTITVVASFYFKFNKVKEGKKILIGLVKPTLQEPGCLYYDLYQDKNNANHFIMLEHWENIDALNLHQQSEHLAAAKALLPDYLVEPIDVKIYHPCEIE